MRTKLKSFWRYSKCGLCSNDRSLIKCRFSATETGVCTVFLWLVNWVPWETSMGLCLKYTGAFQKGKHTKAKCCKLWRLVMYSRTILVTMYDIWELNLDLSLFLFCYFLVFSISKFLVFRALWTSVPKPSARHVKTQPVQWMWEGWGYWVFRWSSGMNFPQCWPVPAATTSLQWNQYNCPLKGSQQSRFLKTIKLENSIKV